MMMRTVLPVAAVSLLCLSGQDRIMPGTMAPKPASQRAQPGAPAQAKPAPQLPVEDDIPTFRGTVQVVLVPTTVTDNKGRTINGLQPQDFVLYDNDKPQSINRDVAFLPLSMVVCIQRSANVDSVLPKIRKMGGVMSDLLIGQDGEAAILSYDHRIEVLQEFTNDAAKIDAAIEKLKPGGQNARLNDSVQTAVRMLRQKKDRRKVILLIAETMDKSSEAKVRDVALDLQMYNIDVFTLNMNRLVTRLTEKPDVPRPDPFPAGTRPMAAGRAMDPTSVSQQHGTGGYGVDFVPVVEEIFTAAKAIFVKNPAEVYTRFTGGREYAFTSQNDLERAITAIGAEIRSQYILSYSPNNKMEGGFHKIHVEVNRPNLKVRTRPGYWMAAVQN